MDNIIYNKAAIIERCIKRIQEEYQGNEDVLKLNITKQDSIILNIQRALQATIDLGAHIVKIEKLGIPQETRDIFVKLNQAGLLESDLAEQLQPMVGFRNIAIHDYQTMNLDIVKSIIDHHLTDIEKFKSLILRKF